ncbi:MAG: hypothetical protein R2812_10165 [Gelidibacter sp.]
MKKILAILFLILCQFGFGQSYEFDYIIEYKSMLNDSIGTSVFYLTNSKDNQYRASFQSIDKNRFALSFYKHGRINFHTTIKKSDFYKAETIVYKGKNYKIKTIGKALAKKVSFQNLKDTIIDEKPYKRYVFNSNPDIINLRTFYIVEPKTEFHLPILSNVDSFVEWTVEKNIPDGIYKEIYYLNPKGEMVEAYYKLVAYQKYKKFISIKN